MVQGQVLQEAQAQETQCRHHWIIEPPHGATSWGQCKICGERKEFPNSAGDSLWERDSGAPAGRWGGVGPSEVSRDSKSHLPLSSMGHYHDREDDGF